MDHKAAKQFRQQIMFNNEGDYMESVEVDMDNKFLTILSLQMICTFQLSL